MRHLEINKQMIPYTFDIVLYGTLYTFRIDYNNKGDMFTVSLSKDVEDICIGEPIIYGVPLFCDLFTRGNFPLVIIQPIDLSGERTAVTYDNISSMVLLVVVGEDDE